jgi:threonine dehydratase
VGAFKVRGGVNLVSQLSADERDRGVITASTGNHGQSVAYAADLFGVRAVVCMPEQSNPVKVESMRALGAKVVFHGRDFDEAREHCEQEAARHGYRYIHSGNEPALIAGVATYTLEILEAWPDTDVIVVPVGGGSGAAGACVVAKAVRSSVEVIGVQSAAAPAAYRSWRAGALVEDTTSTFAEGLATRTAFELPQQILRALLDDFVLVPEDALRAATRLMIEKTRNLVEPAGAAALAAVLSTPGRFADRKVVIVCSGGNISPGQLAALWPRERADTRRLQDQCPRRLRYHRHRSRLAGPGDRLFQLPLVGEAGRARRSVGGGYPGLALQGGRDGAGEFCAPDEQERDRDGGQSGEAGDPERPLEPAGERGGRGVALAQQEAGVGRGDCRGDGYPDRPADLLGGVEQSGGDPGIAFSDTSERSDRHRDEGEGSAGTDHEERAREVRPVVPVRGDLRRPQDPGPDQGHPDRHDELG